MRTRYTLVVEYETLGDELPAVPEDIEADAMHGGLHNYYDVTVTSTRGPEPVVPEGDKPVSQIVAEYVESTPRLVK